MVYGLKLCAKRFYNGFTALLAMSFLSVYTSDRVEVHAVRGTYRAPASRTGPGLHSIIDRGVPRRFANHHTSLGLGLLF